MGGLPAAPPPRGARWGTLSALGLGQLGLRGRRGHRHGSGPRPAAHSVATTAPWPRRTCANRRG
eukprot:13396125-Alexandrium_andersonii.AAC.1